MLTLLLCLTAHAQETGTPAAVSGTEAGTTKKLGVGATVGYPHQVTLKYAINDKAGIAGYLGANTSIDWAMLRVQWEQDFYNIGDWGFGRLDIFWQAGVVLRIQPDAIGPGGGGGAGARLRFKEVPAEVFGEHGIYGFPTAALDRDLAWIGITSSYGGRWYF
ncbi:MAG: hypothetical protein H6739_02440 [Alphaproteobacteria bacterium]|nr:hypothetical protein [Alphaproteobacteria bacterium]